MGEASYRAAPNTLAVTTTQLTRMNRVTYYGLNYGDRRRVIDTPATCYRSGELEVPPPAAGRGLGRQGFSRLVPIYWEGERNPTLC